MEGGAWPYADLFWQGGNRQSKVPPSVSVNCTKKKNNWPKVNPIFPEMSVTFHALQVSCKESLFQNPVNLKRLM